MAKDLSGAPPLALGRDKKILLLLGKDVLSPDEIFLKNHPNIDIVGDGLSKSFSEVGIPYKHYNAVMLLAHGSVIGDSHIIETGISQDSISHIIYATTPRHIYILSCYGGLIEKSIQNLIDMNHIPYIQAKNSLSNINISIISSSDHPSVLCLGKEYLKRVADFNLAQDTNLQEIALVRDEIPETLKQCHIYFDAESRKTKMFVFEISPPKTEYDLERPKQFIGSCIEFSNKLQNAAGQYRTQLIAKTEDPEDPVFVELRDQKIERLSKGTKLFSKDYIQNILKTALVRRNIELFEASVGQGAQVNIPDQTGKNILHFASLLGYSEAVREIVKYKADIDSTCSDGSTSLHLATLNNHVEAVEQLIASKATINLANNRGATALHIAANYGHAKVVAKLIEHGININAVNNAHQTALLNAADRGHLVVVNILIKAQAITDVTENNGATALYFAAQGGHNLVVQALILARAAIDKPDNEGVTPLQIAVHNGHMEAVKTLLDARASLTAIDKKYGITALYFAINAAHKEIARELIKRGASVEAKDIKGDTPLMFAKEIGCDDEMLAILSETKKMPDLGVLATAFKTVVEYFIVPDGSIGASAAWTAQQNLSSYGTDILGDTYF